MTEEEYNLAWKKSIEKAIESLDINGWDRYYNSSIYDVSYNGKLYPPKVVFREATEIFAKDFPQESIPSLSGGIPTNKFLEKIGFPVKSKYLNIDIGDRPIFKFSMGDYFKSTRFTKFNIVERLEKLNLISMHSATKKGQGIYFTNNLKIGDYVYITYGKDKLGPLCKITSEIIELPDDIKKDIDEEGYQARSIKIIAEPIVNNTIKLSQDKRAWLPSGYSTLYEVADINEANKVLFNKYYKVNISSERLQQQPLEWEYEEETFKIILSKHPLNKILYGPPGTGKTYNTKELAVQIANPDLIFDDEISTYEKRKIVNEEYENLVSNGQIVFSTFHQSMSYEDFIEGIKPETNNGDVTYDVVSGVFKELCEKAGIKSSSNFEEVLSKFKQHLIDNEKVTINTGNIEFDVYYKGGKTFKINPKDSKNKNPLYPASIENILKMYQNTPGEGMYNPSYVKGILMHLYSNYGLIKYDSIQNDEIKNHILIIDEINRGNVSQIFGELITLLEEDKRLGNKEALEVVLPYSKEKFGVPPNLYIIGTMNTADRSVEALDTALRRRFSFKELMPQPHLLKNIEFNGFNLREVLEAINNRVEILLDRDHTIGHSYFINIKSNDTKALTAAFKNCIIPLLQEYFYHNYEKIALILGEGFVTVKDTKDIHFASFTKVTLEKPDVIKKFEFINEINDIEKAIASLLNKPVTLQNEG
ncbi:AAA domain-containing protein [Flavobacterium sp. Sd200]|uniref:McrB family protein n=1 Tax=Flavobacterium sp. Sd200 TaxID=2692211 RepID=UPI00136F3576|nr:AAA family ATPase [Flavobacterium sp. Sd200]MXN92861.1 AAA domain-containing protein [Flavobacterium sp. Sd200]